MNRILFWLCFFVAVFLAASLLQIFGALPKRCDDLGPGYYKNPDGTATIVDPHGVHCFGIWEPGFWFPPAYI